MNNSNHFKRTITYPSNVITSTIESKLRGNKLNIMAKTDPDKDGNLEKFKSVTSRTMSPGPSSRPMANIRNVNDFDSRQFTDLAKDFSRDFFGDTADAFHQMGVPERTRSPYGSTGIIERSRSPYCGAATESKGVTTQVKCNDDVRWEINLIAPNNILPDTIQTKRSGNREFGYTEIDN